MFRGVTLPPGQHQIEFRYSPRSVWIGFAVSGLAWAGVAILGFILRARNRRRGSEKKQSTDGTNGYGSG
jgi:hypothetical protein